MQKTKKKVALHGCDDSTYFTMELTDEQWEVVEEIERLSREASTYACMPTLEIGEE